MAIQRNSQDAQKRSAPRKTATRRAASSTGGFEPTPRLMGAEEKRQLILAHAEMRRPHDPVQMMSVWAGVAVCVMVVLVGYWWAATPAYVEAFKQPIAETSLKAATDDYARFKERVAEIPNALKSSPLTTNVNMATSQLEKLGAQQRAREEAAKKMVQLLNASTTEAQVQVRTDLFQPVQHSLSTSTAETVKP